MIFFRPAFLLLIFFFGAEALAQPRNSQNVVTERGFFALEGLGGYNTSRLLNQDGSHAGFKGYQLAGRFSVKVLGSGAGETRLFGQYGLAEEKSSNTSVNKISKEEFLGGIQIYSNPYIFFTLAYGTAQADFKTDTDKVALSYNLVSVGVGLEYPMTGSLSLTLQGMYKSGAIKNSVSSPLTGNSAYEGFDGYLGIVWSPPISNVYTR